MPALTTAPWPMLTMFFVPCELDLWPFYPKVNGFPGITVEHFYVKFDGHSCIGFIRYNVEKQTNKQNTQMPLKNLPKWLPSVWVINMAKA